MHKWSSLPNIANYTLYKQYIDLKQQWLPNKTTVIDNVPIEIDLFDTVESHSDLRPIIVKKQHKQLVATFNPKHPFYVLQHHLSDYKAINTYEVHDLADYVNDSMIPQYRELFYAFNQQPNICNLCNKHTPNPIEYHLCTNCPILLPLRHSYWNNARLILAKIGSKINRCHNQIFMQRVIEYCSDVRPNPETLWRIICGANFYDEKQLQFHYIHQSIDISHPRNTFYKQLLS